MGVENNCILSRRGDVSIAYEVSLPELFTLSDQEYEALHLLRYHHQEKHTTFYLRLHFFYNTLHIDKLIFEFFSAAKNSIPYSVHNDSTSFSL